MKFSKYHALGNDYIVIEPNQLDKTLTANEISAICNRHFGVGSDGILLGPVKNNIDNLSLRIFNPDGSEAEKSGNGLRIFARYLWDQSLVSNEKFFINTKGGLVSACVAQQGQSVSVGMGKVRFTHDQDGEPTISASRINIRGREFVYYLANIGNPHCVVLVDDISPSLAKTYGRLIETDLRFSNRTNVQFVKVIDKAAIQIEIWERGAGYTLASGSSSSAAASVTFALGKTDSTIAVHMPGGIINISLDRQFNCTMSGAVQKICDGAISPEMFITK